jgi:hypothetical protein
VLSQRWSLHDVEDVEGLCGKVLDNRLHRWGGVLSDQDHEDAMSYLLARAWVLYVKFDPWHEATHKRSFSTFLYRRIYSYEVVNWYRLRFKDGRYNRDDPVVLSLDHDADGELSGLDELVPDGQGDPADSLLDLRRVLAG